jgi:hypothetical protein
VAPLRRSVIYRSHALFPRRLVRSRQLRSAPRADPGAETLARGAPAHEAVCGDQGPRLRWRQRLVADRRALRRAKPSRGISLEQAQYFGAGRCAQRGGGDRGRRSRRTRWTRFVRLWLDPHNTPSSSYSPGLRHASGSTTPRQQNIVKRSTRE